PAEVRLYDRLFSVPNPGMEKEGAHFTTYLNPNSLETLASARIEPSLADAEPGSRYQFERLGYFCVDSVDSSDASLVFNRTVTIRDAWAKIKEKEELS
ncbi:MAG: glutamine--tRNA ligase, partial [Proteobacteria bacterium]|nr:glutamine--tRNA ligase [Pseudomonadota bacterium]NIS68381.1 glutamine--tRNA ligase [Pseudomonadota bacterium]